VGAICLCHRHALLPVNHHRDQQNSSNPRPPEIALAFSLESLRSELEELHSADAPAASRKPERGKRSFFDPNFGVPMCTLCAEPAQNDKVDLTHSVTATYPLLPGDAQHPNSSLLSVFPHFVMRNHTDDCLKNKLLR
jgi:hypothetical protein